MHRCSVSSEITPLYFFQLKLHILWKKIDNWSKILGILSGWVKIYQIPHVIFETLRQFFKKNFVSLLMSWEVILLYFFSWKVIWFFKKESIKGQNFRLSTAQVRFRQICTLMGLFCWKCIKFQLKMYKEVMSHDMEKWCKIWRKADLLFQKW